MTDGVYAVMNPVQPSPHHSMPDRALAKAHVAELRNRDRAPLPRCEPGYEEIPGCVKKRITVVRFSPHPANSDAHGSQVGRNPHFHLSSMTKLT